MTWRTYLFHFEGRINRAKMWLFYLFGPSLWLLAVAAIWKVAHLLGTPDPLSELRAEGKIGLAGIALLTFTGASFAALAYVFSAIAAKRLHDRNRSAWWLASAVALIVALTWLSTSAHRLFPSLQAGSLYVTYMSVGFRFMADALGLLILVELFLLPGTVDENKYGSAPLQWKSRAIDRAPGAA